MEIVNLGGKGEKEDCTANLGVTTKEKEEVQCCTKAQRRGEGRYGSLLGVFIRNKGIRRWERGRKRINGWIP